MKALLRYCRRLRLALCVLACLPLLAQVESYPQYVSPVFDLRCKDTPREDCWRYAFLPEGLRLEDSPIGPDWAWQMVFAAPGTNPSAAVMIPAYHRENLPLETGRVNWELSTYPIVATVQLFINGLAQDLSQYHVVGREFGINFPPWWATGGSDVAWVTYWFKAQRLEFGSGLVASEVFGSDVRQVMVDATYIMHVSRPAVPPASGDTCDPLLSAAVYLAPGGAMFCVPPVPFDTVTGWRWRMAKWDCGPACTLAFSPADFIVSGPPGAQQVYVRWARPIEGGLAAGARDWSLLGVRTQPSCVVYRDGRRLSRAFGDWDYAAPTTVGGEWSLRFNSSSDKTDLIQADCLEGEL